MIPKLLSSSWKKIKKKENERHNKTIESIAMGKGLYLKPYKQGFGLYLKPWKGEGLRKKKKTSFLCVMLYQLMGQNIMNLLL